MLIILIHAAVCTLTAVSAPWRALLKSVILDVHDVDSRCCLCLTVVDPPWQALLKRVIFDFHNMDSRWVLCSDRGGPALAGLNSSIYIYIYSYIYMYIYIYI